jgi:hypothetical protein
MEDIKLLPLVIHNLVIYPDAIKAIGSKPIPHLKVNDANQLPLAMVELSIDPNTNTYAVNLIDTGNAYLNQERLYFGHQHRLLETYAVFNSAYVMGTLFKHQFETEAAAKNNYNIVLKITFDAVTKETTVKKVLSRIPTHILMSGLKAIEKHSMENTNIGAQQRLIEEITLIYEAACYSVEELHVNPIGHVICGDYVTKSDKEILEIEVNSEQMRRLKELGYKHRVGLFLGGSFRQLDMF